MNNNETLHQHDTPNQLTLGQNSYTAISLIPIEADENHNTALTTAPAPESNRLSNLMIALYIIAGIFSLLGAVQQLFAAIRFGLALQLPGTMDGVKDGDIHTWWPILKECEKGTCMVPITMGISSYIANVILGVMFFPNTLISGFKSLAVLIILTAQLLEFICGQQKELLPENLLDFTPSVAYPFPKHFKHLQPPTLAFAVFDILSLGTSWTTIPIYVALSMEALTDLEENIGETAYVFLAATVFVNFCSRYVGSREMFRKLFNSLPFWPDFITNTLGIWARSQQEKNALQNLSYLAKHIRRHQFDLSVEQRQEIAAITDPEFSIKRFLELTNDSGNKINFSYTWKEFLQEIGPSFVAFMSLIVYFDLAKDGSKDLNFPDNILLQGYIALPNFLYYLMMFPATVLTAIVGHEILKNKFGSCIAKTAITFLSVAALFAGGNMADKFLEFVADGHANWLNPENSDTAYYALFGSLTLAGLLCSTFPNFIAYITVVQLFHDPQRGDFAELLNEIETKLTVAIADSTYDGYTKYAVTVGMWRDSEIVSVNGDEYFNSDDEMSTPLIQATRNV